MKKLNIKNILIMNNDTVLYDKDFFKIINSYEENILSYLFTRYNMEMLYIDEISIYHKEDMSSSQAFIDPELSKRKFLKKSLLMAILTRLIPNKILSNLMDKKIRKD